MSLPAAIEETSPTAHLPIHQIFHNYNPAGLPNLSERRIPPPGFYSTTSNLEIPIPSPIHLAVAAAFCLGQWLGVEDIVVALAENGRLRPLRVTWSTNGTWEQAVDQVRLCESLFSRDELQDTLQLAHSEEPIAALIIPNGASSLEDHPIRFHMVEPKTLELTASTALFSPAVTRLCVHLVQVLLKTILIHGDEVLSPAYLPENSPFHSNYIPEADLMPLYQPVTEWIDHNARATPDASAVVYHAHISPPSQAEILTYRQLYESSNRLAGYLCHLGLKEGDKVALCMTRDLSFHIALAAVFKAGACYVPIDPELPETRIKFIAEDSHARFVIVNGKSPTALGPKVAIRYPEQAILNAYPVDFTRIIEPESLAYMLYTSGTTGRPKGCLLTHKGLHAAICGISRPCEDITDCTIDRYLGLASIAFDVHLAEILVPWKQGFATTTAPRSEMLEDLSEAIKVVGATHVGCVPSLIEATFGHLEGGIGKVKYLTSGGEKMTDSILENWANRSDFRLMNFYGPSEVTIGCVARPMNIHSTKENIGLPFLGARAYVVSAEMKILPRCTVGELVIEGPLVGKGYHEQPELTQRAFLEWPSKGCWCYKTGDLVRMMPDSTLEIMGRADNQIKLRGIRIESEGISSVLRKASSTQGDNSVDVYTLLSTHPSFRTPQLVSFVAPVSASSIVSTAVKKSGRTPEVLKDASIIKILRAAAQTELPSYMIPSHIIPVQYLPLSGNGKTDSKLMSSFFSSISIKQLGELSREYSITNSSADDMASRLVHLLARHSSIPEDQLDTRSQFFECGLDSISMIKFSADIKIEFGVLVSIASLMDKPTIGDTVNAIRDVADSDQPNAAGFEYLKQFALRMGPQVSSIRPIEEVECIYPALPVQEGVLYRSLEDATLYVQHFVHRLSESLDVQRLKQAWNSAQEQVEILRATFLFDAGTLSQIILRPNACPVFWEDHVLEGEENFCDWFHDGHAAHISQTLVRTSETIPPFRLNLYCHDGNHRFLVLSIHHALYDAIALPLLLEHIQNIYLNRGEGIPPKLSPFVHYLVCQEDESARRFWLDQLRGFDWNNVQSTPSSLYPSNISREIRTSLREAARSASFSHVTLHTLLCAVFALVLGDGQMDDIVFGMIRSGRSIPVSDADKAILPLISVQPLRVKLQSGSRRRLLEQVQLTSNAMQHFEHVPLGKVQSIVCPGRQMFDTLFSLSYDNVETQSALWDLESPRSPSPDYIFALEVVANPKKDSLVLRTSFSQDDVSSSIVEKILTKFDDILSTWDPRANENGRNPLLKNFSHKSLMPKLIQTLPASASIDEAREAQIRCVACSILDIEEHECHSSMSMLTVGLDSIKAVTLSKHLRRTGIHISSRDIMKNPTIRDISSSSIRGSAISGSGDNNGPQSHYSLRLSTSSLQDLVKLYIDDNIEVYPATTLQSGMLTQSVTSKDALYVHAFPLRFKDPPDLRVLKEAWTKTVNQLAILRTSFHFMPESGLWAQAIHSRAPLLWTVTDVDSEKMEQTLSEFMSQSRFNTEQALHKPPFCVGIFRVHAAYVIQVVVMHHALYDGASIKPLFDLVRKRYSGSAEATRTQFVHVLPSIISAEKAGTSFWEVQLRGSKPLIFPRTRATAGMSTSLILSSNPLAINRVCRNLQVTAQSIGQGALWKALSRTFQTSDVVFGHVVSGRDLPNTEDVIGPMLNTIPCRLNVPRNVPFLNKDLVVEFHRRYIDALPWQHSSLRSIQRRVGASQLWDALFLYQPAEPGAEEPDEFWEFQHYDPSGVKVQYGLNIEIHVQINHVLMKVASAERVMSHDELMDFTRLFDECFTELVEHPYDHLMLPLVLPALPSPSDEEEKRQDIPISSSFAVDNSVIEVLKAIVAQCIDIQPSQIDEKTDLVALGVDSIVAMQIAAKGRKKGLSLGASDVIQSRSIRALATRTARGTIHAAASGKVVSTTPLRSTTMKWKPTAGMRWLIGAWQGSRGCRFQHVFVYRATHGRLDISQARRAWRRLVERHQILKTHFIAGDAGTIECITLHGSSPAWSEETHVNVVNEYQWISDRAEAMVGMPMDPSSPPTRCSFIRLPLHDYLILHLHHFQYDAWSLSLLMDDFDFLYRNMSCESNNDPGPFLNLYKKSQENLEEQRRYWQSLFSETFACTTFPSLTTVCGHSGKTDERLNCLLSSLLDNLTYLEGSAKRNSVSLNCVFLASWAKIQASFCKTSNVTFGLWQAGRSGPIPDIEILAFPCLNILPMHVTQCSGHSLLDIALQIQKDFHRRNHVIEQSDLLDIANWLNIRKPAANVFINILRDEQLSPSTSRKLLESVHIPYSTPTVAYRPWATNERQFDITSLIRDDIMIDFVYSKKGDALSVHIECDSSIMNLQQAEEILQSWAREVRGALL